MIRMNIIPLSVNKAWKGRRIKTDAYKAYEYQLLLTLPAIYFDTAKKDLAIHLEFGFSNIASDIDNPTKNLLDILCKKYGFDDKQVYRLTIEKKIVKKGNEYIAFDIIPITK